MAFAMQKQRMAMAVANSMAMSEGDASDNLKQDVSSLGMFVFTLVNCL